MSDSKREPSSAGGGKKGPPNKPIRTTFADPPDSRKQFPVGKPLNDRDDFIEKLKRRG